MADRVEIRIPDFIFNEGSSFTATVNFRDRASQAASTPTTIHYRIDCLSTGTTIVDWTAVSSPAGDKKTELKQLTVQADRGLTTQSTGRVLYRVRNLEGV